MKNGSFGLNAPRVYEIRVYVGSGSGMVGYEVGLLIGIDLRRSVDDAACGNDA
jgi:hypothetical protein